MESDKKQVFLTCKVCDLQFTDIAPLEQHLKGKSHKKQVKDNERQSQIETLDGNGEQDKRNSSAEEYTCDICETTFNGTIPYNQHIKSMPHAEALQKRKADEDPTELKDDTDSELQDNNGAGLCEIVKEIVPEPYGECFICEKRFSCAKAYSQHMRSTTHAKRKSELQHLKKMKSKLSSCEGNYHDKICEEVQKSADEGQDMECEVCEKDLTGVAAFAQHLTSKQHAKIESQNKLLEEINGMELEFSSASVDKEPLEELTCQVCKKTLSGPENAKSHFKSKRHKKAVEWKKYLAKKTAIVEQSTGINTTVPTKAVIVSPSVSTEFRDGNENFVRETPSAPPLPDDDEECQTADVQIESKHLTQNQERNHSFTTKAEERDTLGPDLQDSHDAETKNVTEGNSGDKTTNSGDPTP